MRRSFPSSVDLRGNEEMIPFSLDMRRSEELSLNQWT